MNATFQELNLQKRKPVYILILLFLSLSLNCQSQFQPTPVKRSDNQITINGRNFYLHEVIKGQTLYGISKEYKVNEEEIKKYNPDLRIKSVFPGMVLRIPDTEKGNTGVTAETEGKFINHTVLPKETLYSISRQYGIKIDDIRELNPDIRWGLKTGQIIRIPKDQITLEQPNILVINEEADDAPADFEEPDVKTENQPCLAQPFPHINDSFHMAVLLPLNIAQNDTLVYSDSLKPEHFRFYEFLEGIYLAMDSIKSQGLNLTVEIFDTERNTATIQHIIDEGKLKNADIIIGPVFPNEIELVAAFAKEQHIPIVSPFSTYNIAAGNPYAFQVRNKLARQVDLATSYLGSLYNQNILVLGRLEEKENTEFLRFTHNLGEELIRQDPNEKAGYKTIYYSETSRVFTNGNGKPVQPDQYLSRSLTNFIILTSENEVYITEVINQLRLKSVNWDIHVFGMNQWTFRNIDLGNLFNVNLELYSDLQEEPFIDFSDPDVAEFRRKYRENWNIEPSVFSFHGFDIAWYFTNVMFKFGRNLTTSVPCWQEFLDHPVMLTPMKFEGNGTGNGFDNHAIAIFRYQKDEFLRKRVN